MIDWINLGSNTLWILGLVIILATFSYASWESNIHAEKFTTRLKRAPVQLCLNISGVFFCWGMAATSTIQLQLILWLLLSALFLIQVFRLGHKILRGLAA